MIPELGISLLAVGGFALALWRSRIVAATEDAVELSVSGLLTMLDAELDDATKEVAVRRAGLGLIVGGLRILWCLVVALAAALVPIALADALGLVVRDDVLELLVRPWFVVAVSVLAAGAAVLVRRRRPAPLEEAGDGQAAGTTYSPSDRFVHAVAFCRPGVLKAAARLEDRLLSTAAVAEPAGPPIFITSIARAGTTALLNALDDVPGVATHTYRDMPFVTAPSLWNRVAGGRRRRVERHERAHGDGLEIDLDSPEAFEEVVWKLFWPGKFRGPTIERWDPTDRDPEAEDFLRRHMARVVAARVAQGRTDSVTSRYCSKNNANVARLGLIAEAFPDASIVVPVRRPENHAASLLRQHQNFLERQADDDFVGRYMRDIGHFEFGLLHKPIAFPGFDPAAHDPQSGDYWLDYWVHAYQEVLEHRDRIVVVTQDDLRSHPQPTVDLLCRAVGLDRGTTSFREHFRAVPDRSPTDGYDPRLLERATELYRELEARALR